MKNLLLLLLPFLFTLDASASSSTSESDVQKMDVAGSNNSATTTTTTTTSKSKKKRKRPAVDPEERERKTKSRKKLEKKYYENTVFTIEKTQKGTIKNLDGQKISGTPYSLVTALRGDCATFKDFVGAFKYLQQQSRYNTFPRETEFRLIYQAIKHAENPNLRRKYFHFLRWYWEKNPHTYSNSIGLYELKTDFPVLFEEILLKERANDPEKKFVKSIQNPLSCEETYRGNVTLESLKALSDKLGSNIPSKTSVPNLHFILRNFRMINFKKLSDMVEN